MIWPVYVFVFYWSKHISQYNKRNIIMVAYYI